MKTPKEYVKLINKGMVTEDILGEVLYSYNKRAKNYRDKKNEYRNRYDNYNDFEKNQEKEKEYYSKKEFILNLFNIVEIHKDIKIKSKRVRLYDYQDDFENITEERVVHRGRYFDDVLRDVVEFVDIIKQEEIILYFLYYKVGDYTFHTPIVKGDIEKYYKNLQIINLQDFVTKGKDINDLLSVQFCDKVYEKLINEELKIINKELEEV